MARSKRTALCLAVIGALTAQIAIALYVSSQNAAERSDAAGMDLVDDLLRASQAEVAAERMVSMSRAYLLTLEPDLLARAHAAEAKLQQTLQGLERRANGSARTAPVRSGPDLREPLWRAVSAIPRGQFGVQHAAGCRGFPAKASDPRPRSFRSRPGGADRAQAAAARRASCIDTRSACACRSPDDRDLRVRTHRERHAHSPRDGAPPPESSARGPRKAATRVCYRVAVALPETVDRSPGRPPFAAARGRNATTMTWHIIGWSVVMGGLAWLLVRMWTDRPPHRGTRGRTTEDRRQ